VLPVRFAVAVCHAWGRGILLGPNHHRYLCLVTIRPAVARKWFGRTAC